MRGIKRKLWSLDPGWLRFEWPGMDGTVPGRSVNGFEAGTVARIVPLPKGRWPLAQWPEERHLLLRQTFPCFMLVNREGRVRFFGQSHEGQVHVDECRCPWCTMPEVANAP